MAKAVDPQRVGMYNELADKLQIGLSLNQPLLSNCHQNDAKTQLEMLLDGDRTSNKELSLRYLDLHWFVFNSIFYNDYKLNFICLSVYTD